MDGRNLLADEPGQNLLADERRAPPAQTGYAGGFASAFSGLGQNLSAAMQGTNPDVGEKKFLGDYTLLDSGHAFQNAQGKYEQVDPTRHVVLNNPATNKPGVFERDQPVNSISARADALGRILGTGAMAPAPLNTQLAAPLSQEVRTLRDAGVNLTPGQASGGFMRYAEDMLKNLPGVRYFVGKGEQRALESFNTGAINKALFNISEKVSEKAAPGTEQIADMHAKIGSAYDRIIKSRSVQGDQQLLEDMTNTLEAAKQAKLPNAEYLDGLISKEVWQRLGENGAFTGDNAQKAWSALNAKAAELGRSQDAYQRDLAPLVRDAANAVRGAFERSNPGMIEELSKVDRAYAMSQRITEASVKAGNKEGVFSPSQLLLAAKQGDKTMNKRAFSEGEALMQDYGMAGQKVLPPVRPNSGTPEGMAMLGAPAAAAYFSTPAGAAIGAGVGASVFPYLTSGTQRLTTGLLTKPYINSPVFRAYGKSPPIGLLGQGFGE